MFLSSSNVSIQQKQIWNKYKHTYIILVDIWLVSFSKCTEMRVHLHQHKVPLQKVMSKHSCNYMLQFQTITLVLWYIV